MKRRVPTIILLIVLLVASPIVASRLTDREHESVAPAPILAPSPTTPLPPARSIPALQPYLVAVDQGWVSEGTNVTSVYKLPALAVIDAQTRRVRWRTNTGLNLQARLSSNGRYLMQWSQYPDDWSRIPLTDQDLAAMSRDSRDTPKNVRIGSGDIPKWTYRVFVYDMRNQGVVHDTAFDYEDAPFGIYGPRLIGLARDATRAYVRTDTDSDRLYFFDLVQERFDLRTLSLCAGDELHEHIWLAPDETWVAADCQKRGIGLWLQFVSLRDGAVLGKLNLPGRLYRDALSPDGTRLYLVDGFDRRLIEIDTQQRVITRTLDLPKQSRHTFLERMAELLIPRAEAKVFIRIVIAPDGKTLYVSEPGNVLVVSTETLQVTAQFRTPQVQAVWAVSPDRRELYVEYADKEKGRYLAVLNAATGNKVAELSEGFSTVYPVLPAPFSFP